MKREKGSATIIEYTLVLPLVFAIVFTLIFVGFGMHQKAVMEGATQRAAIYVARTIVDTNYENITNTDSAKDANDITEAKITKGAIINNPYRYLFSSKNVETEYDVAELIKKNQIFIDADPSVEVKKEKGVFTKVTVIATQEYNLPKLLPGLELPPFITIETKSVVYVNQPAEFIRNADYVIDIVESTGIVDKLNTVVTKIKFFNKNVK